MSEALRKIKEQIASHEKKSPAYQVILVFYEKIIEAQEAVKPSVDIILPEISEELRAIQTKEGFPLINPNDFVIDIRSSVSLFESICHIAKNATEKMRINIQAMEEALAINALNLREILRKHSDESYLNAIAKEFDIDIAILKFLVHMSIQPSIEADVEKLKDLVDLKNWLKGYCPVCGSSPLMSGLRGEGQRYFLCSFCGFLWPGERLKCPFCENRDQEKLHYFYEEGREEAYRVDLCDNCKQYVKTVDARKLGYEPDLNLGDITTVHLDILASQKGFKRPAPGHWAF